MPNWFWNPVLLVHAMQNPLKEGVPESVPDSFPESSRTSLSSVWFAGTTPDINSGTILSAGKLREKLVTLRIFLANFILQWLFLFLRLFEIASKNTLQNKGKMAIFRVIFRFQG